MQESARARIEGPGFIASSVADDVRSTIIELEGGFTASIRDDVRLTRPGASDREVERALRRARVWEPIADAFSANSIHEASKQ